MKRAAGQRRAKKFVRFSLPPLPPVCFEFWPSFRGEQTSDLVGRASVSPNSRFSVVHNNAISSRALTKTRELWRAELDKSPQLSGAFLARHGFLADEPILRGFESRGLYFIVEKKHDGLLTIVTLDESGNLVQHIDFFKLRNGAVCKPYFICPVKEVPCSNLYFHYGCWASRYAFRVRTVYYSAEENKGKEMDAVRDALVGTAGRSPARGRKHTVVFNEAKAALNRIGIVPNSWWKLEPVFEKAALADRLQRRRQERSPRPLVTPLDYAICCGGVAGYDEIKRYKAGGMSAATPPNLNRPPLADRAPSNLEDYAFIDFKALRQRNWLKPGYVIAYRLKWPRELCDQANILMIVDTREAAPQLVFEFTGKDLYAPYRQVVPIRSKPTMPGRRFFVCPVMGTEHQRLFLRDGFFASQAAHGLRYRSQAPLQKA